MIADYGMTAGRIGPTGTSAATRAWSLWRRAQPACAARDLHAARPGACILVGMADGVSLALGRPRGGSLVPAGLVGSCGRRPVFARPAAAIGPDASQLRCRARAGAEFRGRRRRSGAAPLAGLGLLDGRDNCHEGERRSGYDGKNWRD